LQGLLQPSVIIILAPEVNLRSSKFGNKKGADGGAEAGLLARKHQRTGLLLYLEVTPYDTLLHLDNASVYHIQRPWLPLIFKITYQIFP
ncbi:hypothetical protein, partial [Limosilactobacillus fermentum]